MKKNKKKLIICTEALLICIVFIVTAYFGSLSIAKTLYPIEYDEFVEDACISNKLEKSFVYAVIKCESNFNSDAVSKVGARGLMQLMPETFTWLQTKTGEKLDDELISDPETSIKYGCLLFKILINEFGDLRTAVTAYHAGIGTVSKWLKDEKYSSDGVHLKDIPYPTTKQYVERVLKTQKIYNTLYK